MNASPQLLDTWPAERELSINEVDVIKKLAAPKVLDAIEEEGIDVLTHDGALVLRDVAKGIAPILDFDDSMARALAISVEVLAVERKFG